MTREKDISAAEERPPGSQGPWADVAVLVPCYNEALTIGKVVRDFQAALPGATVWVFDNNSTDDTARLAREGGAVVVPSPRQGKGHVVRHMFAHVDAGVYVMADGDDTYPAAEAPRLVQALVGSDADMVVGTRLEAFDSGAFRRFHQLGNWLVAFLVSRLFRVQIRDPLSGYRAFTREFVRTAPLVSGGFGIETEMTLSALAREFVIREVPVRYGKRPPGSHSKLDTFSDGYVVLEAIVMLFKDYKPLAFFGTQGVVLAGLTLLAGGVPVWDFVQEGFVYHVPLAILATSLGVLSALSVSVGLVLSTFARYQRENYELLRRLLSR